MTKIKYFELWKSFPSSPEYYSLTQKIFLQILSVSVAEQCESDFHNVKWFADLQNAGPLMSCGSKLWKKAKF